MPHRMYVMWAIAICDSVAWLPVSLFVRLSRGRLLLLVRHDGATVMRSLLVLHTQA